MSCRQLILAGPNRDRYFPILLEPHDSDRTHASLSQLHAFRTPSKHATGEGFLIAVVGAGAAGIMAAIFAARKGGDVLLLESTKDGGKKILISGGGRCNILPSLYEPNRFVTASSRNSLNNILKSWPLTDQGAFLESELDQRLILEEETGKLFPKTNRARDVRDGLLRSATEAGAKFWPHVKVVGIEKVASASTSWRVNVETGQSIDATHVIVATGGLSVPQTGSDGKGLSIAAKLGHTVNTTYPALTPLLSSTPQHTHLAGVSLGVSVKTTKSRFTTTGGFLFTHRGYSGPAILDASHLYTRAMVNRQAPPTLRVEWTHLGNDEWNAKLQSGKGAIVTQLAHHLPRRLAEQILIECCIDHDQNLAQLTKKQRRLVVEALTQYTLTVDGDEGYRKAEVTGGGIALGEINPRTMESRLHPGLFFCGEILDAFGPIGGYNFQWAWATGRAAGLGAATP